MQAGNDQPKVSVLGTSAMLFEVSDAFSLQTQSRIWALAERAKDWPHIREVVSGMTNLMLVFDEPPAEIASLEQRLREGWASGIGQIPEGALIEIGVAYGGPLGPDLGAVAKITGLPAEEVVARHSGTVYTVYAVGSHPGYGYMGELDESLFVPRRAEPRLSMPAGSVSIAGRQTGVSASEGPTGWHTLGHAELSLFDAHAAAPCLLSPGDRVRFFPISITP